MKTINKILIGAAVVWNTNVDAQISIGGRFGVTSSNVVAPTLSNTFTFNNIYQYSAALAADIPIGTWLAVQPEINYLNKGFSSKLGTDVTLFNIKLPIGVTAETRFQHIEVPLLLKAKFGNERVQGYLTAGPSLGYALTGRLIGRTSLVVDVKIYDDNINLNSNNVNRFEVSGVVGGGIGIETGKGQLVLDARYTRGLGEAYEIPYIGTRVTNQGFGVSIGYMHRLFDR